MTTLYHAHAARNDGPLVPDRAAIIAEDDRRRTPMRLLRAEAERGLARYRRLRERFTSDRVAFAQAAALAASLDVTRCTPEKAVRLIGPRPTVDAVRGALGPAYFRPAA